MANIGGWSFPGTPDVTKEAAAALAEATDRLVGSKIEAFALIGVQIVNGKNYRILCKVTPVTPEPNTKTAIYTIHAPLSGKAEIMEQMEIF